MSYTRGTPQSSIEIALQERIEKLEGQLVAEEKRAQSFAMRAEQYQRELREAQDKVGDQLLRESAEVTKVLVEKDQEIERLREAISAADCSSWCNSQIGTDDYPLGNPDDCDCWKRRALGDDE